MLLEIAGHWSFLLFIWAPLIVIGIFVVPVALIFAEEGKGRVPFTQHNTHKYWRMVHLPAWAWIWDNERDGANGDPRGWWDLNCYFWGDSGSFLNQYWWLAFRNPVNNLTFNWGLAVNMEGATVSLLAGQDYVSEDSPGWQFLMADGPKYHCYGFYYASKPWIDTRWTGKRAFVVRIGHKIQLWHNDHDWTADYMKVWKGYTVRANPFVRVGWGE